MQDILKTSSRHVYKTSSRYVFKTSSRPVFKASSRHVFKTSSRGLQCNNFFSSKTSWRRLGRQNIIMLKTCWRCLQDMSWGRLEDQQMFTGWFLGKGKLTPNGLFQTINGFKEINGLLQTASLTIRWCIVPFKNWKSWTFY